MARLPAERLTRQVRVYDDLAEMIGWINDVEDENVADIIDPILRPGIESRYARIERTVKAIKAARAKVQHDLVEEPGG